VISSEVKYHSGSHGGTYSVNTFYTYEINGREFKSNTYDFAGGSSSGYEGKQAVVPVSAERDGLLRQSG